MIRTTVLAALLGATFVLPACAKETAAPAASIPEGAHAVTVDGAGYHPATLNLPAGQPATLVFTRTSDDGCGQQLAFPTLGIHRDLPLNQPVVVELTPQAGEIRFTCGMDMYRGTIVAQ